MKNHRRWHPLRESNSQLTLRRSSRSSFWVPFQGALIPYISTISRIIELICSLKISADFCCFFTFLLAGCQQKGCFLGNDIELICSYRFQKEIFLSFIQQSNCKHILIQKSIDNKKLLVIIALLYGMKIQYLKHYYYANQLSVSN